MRFTFLVGVDINLAELEALNAKRKRLGQQPHTATGFIENKVVEALSIDKLTINATCVQTGLSKLREAVDPDATL